MVAAKAILEKSASFLFVDLAKAYDSVPHDLLWSHLRAMGFHIQFIKVLVNGHETDNIQVRSGVKQGCPLSPSFCPLLDGPADPMCPNFCSL